MSNTQQNNQEKTRFDLVPFTAVAEIADVLAYGAKKYEANNWCRGTNWGRYFSALCRHLFAWWGGENTDPETGYSHLAHAGCCLIFLMEYQRNGWGTDDRFTGPDGEEFTKHDGVSSGEEKSELSDIALDTTSAETFLLWNSTDSAWHPAMYVEEARTNYAVGSTYEDILEDQVADPENYRVEYDQTDVDDQELDYWDPTLGPVELTDSEVAEILEKKDLNKFQDDEIVSITERRGLLIGVRKDGSSCLLNSLGKCETV